MFQELIAKNVGMPLKSLFKGDKISRVLPDLVNNQYLSCDELYHLQTSKLKNLLCYVKDNIPFYSKLLNSMDVDPNHEDPWELLYLLPLMDKETYRNNSKDLMPFTNKISPSIGYTSGSTGDRFKYHIDKNAIKYMYLSGYRGRMWSGIYPGDIQYKIWGNGSYSFLKKSYSKKFITRSISDWLLGRYVISPKFNNDSDLAEAVQLLLKIKPKFVFGYANSLYSVAKYIVDNNIVLGPDWPKVVFYTSEMLYDAQKEVVKNAFRCSLMSEYGSAEFGVMAHTCPEGQFHVSDDLYIMEVFDGDNKLDMGQTGEIVVTNLMSLNYPMIRYRHGDIGAYSKIKCQCGLNFGILSDLQGRKNDILKSPSGKEINFLGFGPAFKGQEHIKRFKVIERDTGDLLLFCELIGVTTWPIKDRETFLNTCKQLLPSDVTLEIGYIGKLQNDNSGKFKIIIPSNQAKPYLDLMVQRKNI
ncbi:MAG: phenylacetate--CoA ligase family protein [Phycisphaerae bacterium]|nr:phenylacetate--CoA ligase family protein [Phycisphaerae bacterium]